VTELARILRDCLRDLGIDEERLLVRAGVREMAIGRRMLRQLVEDPLQKGPFARRVIAALGPVGERFEMALDLALAAKEPQRKSRKPPLELRPRVRILTFPPPSRSMGGTMLANYRFAFDVPPDWSELPLREGIARVAGLFAAWRHRHPKARILGFVWRRRPGEVWEFDEHGEPVARHERFPLGDADVLPGGRTLSELSETERAELFARYGCPVCPRRQRQEETDGRPA